MMVRTVIKTRSGKWIVPWELKADDVLLRDVAFALSHLCRFTGHTKYFYSVAQHSVLVSNILEQLGEPKEHVIAGLYHDAAEAYIGDLNSPTKVKVGASYIDLEEAALPAIKQAFNIKSFDFDALDRADQLAFEYEFYALLGGWDNDPHYSSAEILKQRLDKLSAPSNYIENLTFASTGLSPSEAEKLFLRRGNDLHGGLINA